MRKETVAILMPTFNGVKYIEAQIESIINQKNCDVHFYISDDGSNDGTLKILEKYIKNYPKIFKKLYKVNFKHPVKNYVSLALRMPEYKFYALADQDDVWFEDKLIHAISKLNSGYSLYGGRVIVTDKNLKKIDYSPLFEKPTTFANALVQNISGANTMVFDYSIMKIFRKIKKHPTTSMDWILYLLTTFNGNKVFYDKVPKIYYRQHENNDHGIGSSFNHKLKLLKFLLNGNYKKFNDQNISMLNEADFTKIKDENVRILKNYNAIRSKKISFFDFLKKKNNEKVYRQTIKGNIILKLSLLLGFE